MDTEKSRFFRCVLLEWLPGIGFSPAGALLTLSESFVFSFCKLLSESLWQEQPTMGVATSDQCKESTHKEDKNKTKVTKLPYLNWEAKSPAWVPPNE